MDNFITLYNRLLSRCPAVGPELAKQLINDSWHTLQSRREWSWRRRHNTFAPPNLYNAGSASTNAAIGNPTVITGFNTDWSPSMIGRQIRVGGLLYPFYTIVGYQSPTSIVIDEPWAGPDVAGQAYDILGAYYTVPDDFGYFYAVVSIKDSYRLWTDITEADLAILDPQRTNFGQTSAVAFKDYTPIYGGNISPVISSSPTIVAPVSTTSTGYSYPLNSTFIVQVLSGGISGVATFQWMMSGQTAFTGPVFTSDQPTDLAYGVQVYWPDGVAYVPSSIFIINCQAQISTGAPRYELWPNPTFSGYLYPYIYIAKESDLTIQQPQLPPFIANRGEVLLEMALEKCAEYPGADDEHINIYHDLRQAQYHANKVKDMLIDLERNDEEVGVSLIDYQIYPYYPAPWLTGDWQQTHAPFLNG
jgi:hypothetical protein